jgi:hypothetical protein
MSHSWLTVSKNDRMSVRRNRAGQRRDLTQIPGQLARRGREIVLHLQLGPELGAVPEIAAKPRRHLGANMDLFPRKPHTESGITPIALCSI